jgi:endo-1,4-beta-xylanase
MTHKRDKFLKVSTQFFVMLVSVLSMCVAHAALPEPTRLLEEQLGVLKVYGPNSPQNLAEEVPVIGQSFDKALRINTYGKSPGKGEYGMTARVTTNLKAGDVLWVSFKARKIDSKRETGDAFFELRFDQLVNGKYRWPAYMDRGISIGSEWTETSIPFLMTKDVTPEDVRLIFRFDTYEQSFEIGPVRLLNYGAQVKLSELPRSVVTYLGGEPDAPWRKETLARIEKNRKGDLSINVLNKKGRPVSGAEIDVRMVRNAFNWGTAVNAKEILDPSPAGDKYREILKKYFNQAVYENEGKVRNWSRLKPEERGVKTKQASEWLRQNGLTVRGHVLVWPSWNQTPPYAAYKNEPDKLRAAIDEGIEEQLTKMKGVYDEWDVMNEATINHDVMDLLGPQEMVRWFKQARAGAPGVKLFYNDFTMFHGTDANSKSQKFYNIAKYLKDNGAPFDVIGEQAHIGGTPPAIPFVFERLDYFSQLGYPIQISEFDINNNDDEFKARYLTDFMTAVYSHPNTVGFVQWGHWAGSHWFPVAALWNQDWTIRQHGQAYVDLVTKTWWTDADLKTDAKGAGKLRGFTGDYVVTVKYKGQIVKQKVHLVNKGQAVTIRL